jgi:hypothetical protein
MLDQNNNEIQVGQYLKVVGCKVKGDNGIYIVDKKYSEDSFCLYKVLQNGERSTTKYNIYFLDFKRDPNRVVTIISKDQLKQASNEVKNYVEGVTANEVVYSFFKAAEQKPAEGLYLHFKKSVRLNGHINSVAGTYEITKVDKENRIALHMVGKRGEKVAWNTNGYYQFQPIMLSFKADTVQKLFDGEYIEIWERHESKKGEQQKEVKPEMKQEEQQEEDILSKFDKVEVTNNSRISEEDETFCKNEQELYKDAISSILAFTDDIKNRFGVDITKDRWTNETSNNKYIDPYNFRGFSEMARKVKEKFVQNIVWYFTEKYSVTLNSDKIIEKYGFDITYENILDDIFIQMGGYTFKEKALAEIKDAIYNKTYNKYHNKFYITVKGDKISFEETYLGWSETSKYEYVNGNRIYKPVFQSGYRGGECLKPYLDAISWFEYGKVYDIKKSLRDYTIYITPDEFKNGISLDGSKVLKLKFFKNGRMDVTFKTPQLARQFAKEFCKYTEQTA